MGVVDDHELVLDISQLERWEHDGWLLIEHFIEPYEAKAACADLRAIFPSADSVWREHDPRFLSEQYQGRIEFPFRGSALNMVVVHERFHTLALQLLQTDEYMLYEAHAWAKYTGSADYDQHLHRDYGSHTLLVPRFAREYRQFESMLYLTDVHAGNGPTHLVSRRHSKDLPWTPEFFPRAEHPELYEHEVAATAPAGSLLVWAPDVLHRASNLIQPGASRFVITIGYQVRCNPWMGYHSWPFRGEFGEFMNVIRASSPRQLQMIGFPRPGDRFWTDETVRSVEERYDIDLGPFRPR